MSHSCTPCTVSNCTHAPRSREREVVVVVGDHVAVPDHHAGRVDALLDEQVELGGADRPAGGVGGDRQAGTPVGAGRRPERPLLDRRDDPVAADLADDPGAHPVDALLDVADDQVGDGVGRQLVELGREVGAAVEPAAPHDLQPRGLGHPSQRGRVAVQPAGGDVDERAAAGVGVPPQLSLGQRRVVEQAVAPVLPRQVEEDVLVRQRHAQVVGGHRAGHGHHGHRRILPAG